MDHQRVASLDGLRAFAIGLVLFFHLIPHAANLIPWPTEYVQFWPFRYGYLGVQLFFLISGFLIAKSVRQSSGFLHFLTKRWLRLFPAMVAATFLILVTSPLLPYRPLGQPKILDALPGLLFIHPYFFEKFLSLSVVPLEWAYWSLFVEVVFYMIFGALYFTRRNYAVSGLAVIYILSAIYKILKYFGLITGFTIADKMIDACFIHFGWFFLGAFLEARKNAGNTNRVIVTIVMLGLSILTTVGADWAGILMCLILYSFFNISLAYDSVARFFSASWMVSLGIISYPLYLIHENALVAMTISVHSAWPDFPILLMPLPGLILVLFIAWCIAKYAEPLIKFILINILKGAGLLK